MGGGEGGEEVVGEVDCSVTSNTRVGCILPLCILTAYVYHMDRWGWTACIYVH